jgi:hypothetical protein
MREPYFVNCDGTPDFVWVVERLKTARYLGPGKRSDVNVLLARPVTVAVRHGGRWGKEEVEAVERCNGRGRGPGADRIEEVVEKDQSPNQASPPGRSSAE